MIDFPPTNVKEGKVNSLKIFFQVTFFFQILSSFNLFPTAYLSLEPVSPPSAPKHRYITYRKINIHRLYWASIIYASLLTGLNLLFATDCNTSSSTAVSQLEKLGIFIFNVMHTLEKCYAGQWINLGVNFRIFIWAKQRIGKINDQESLLPSVLRVIFYN